MPSRNQAYLDCLDKVQLSKILSTHMPLGYQPETKDRFFVPDLDRFSGTYILGVQDTGKTCLIENLIAHDILYDQAVIAIDPHGDLTAHCIAQLPADKLAKTYLFDLTDTDYPFGVNLFSGLKIDTALAQSQGVMHIFEALWDEVLTQAHLPRFLRAATIALFANPGSTLVDMYKFLTDDLYRQIMLKAVKDYTVHAFWRSFDQMSLTTRRQQIDPLLGRLDSLFTGRPLVRNIVSQRENTIDCRRAIENKEIIFIRLPLKTLTQDSRLIGTLLIAQIHAALFSFADLPEHKRPGFSLYVDEFEHFTTTDFNEMFAEGRKFGARVTVAHQYRGQLPGSLRESTMTARTKVCFQTTLEDGKEVPHLFLGGEVSIKPEDIESRPVEKLMRFGSDNPSVQTFINRYLLPLQSHVSGGHVEIIKPGPRWDNWSYWIVNLKPPDDKIVVPDPTPFLNSLLHQVMKQGGYMRPLPLEIVYGFSNCGLGFFTEFRYSPNKSRQISADIKYPSALVVEGAHGLRFAREPENGKEQLFHFLFYLRQTMYHLSKNPLGKRNNQTAAEIARMLTQLPKRAAFIRSSEDVGVIYTDKTLKPCNSKELGRRYYLIRGQTRQKYCKPKDLVETPMSLPNEPEHVLSRWEEVK